MSRVQRLGVSVLGILICDVVAAAAGASEIPVAVSPWGAAGFAEIADRCPTFSWGEVEGTRAYELVVYGVGEEAEEESAQAGMEGPEVLRPVLRQELPGRVSSWTPPVAQCLTPGGRYAWSVRAVGEAGAGEWSETRLFFLSAVPSVAEVQESLRLLRQYVAGGGSLEGLEAGEPAEPERAKPAEAEAERPAGPGTGRGGESPLLPGVAAIRGEQTDATGETYGVYGISHSDTGGSLGVVGEALATTGEVFGVGGVTASAEGAGVAALNTAEGPDMVLVSETSDSAYLTELGLDRPSDLEVTFELKLGVGGGISFLDSSLHDLGRSREP